MSWEFCLEFLGLPGASMLQDGLYGVFFNENEAVLVFVVDFAVCNRSGNHNLASR